MKFKNSNFNVSLCLGSYLLVLILTMFFFFQIMIPACGQQLPRIKEVSDVYYSQFNYLKASQYYEKALGHKSGYSSKNIRRIVDCYYHLRNYSKWIYWSSKAVTLKETNGLDHYYYGLALQSSGAYDSARVEFQKSKGSSLVARLPIDSALASCIWAKTSLAQIETYKVENLTYLNTTYADFSPSFYGDSIVFVSDRPYTQEEITSLEHPNRSKKYFGWTGNVFLKMFQTPGKNIVNRKSGQDSIGVIREFSLSEKEKYHSGPAVFSSDGNKVFFTRTMEEKKVVNGIHGEDSLRYFRGYLSATKEKGYDLNISFIHRLEIWYSAKVNGIWQKPVSLPYNQKGNYSLTHPALSPDGKTLYFSSDMPGGKGGFDLYYCEISTDTSFSKPVNISSLNTMGDDEFPFIDKLGNLYFSSNGRTGYGGLDIFQAKGSLETWTDIHNMGRRINSNKDDFGLLMLTEDGKLGMVSSNREGGKGSDDLYSFERRTEGLNIVVKSNRNGQRIPNAHLTFYNQGATEIAQMTDGNGFLHQDIDQGKSFNITAQRVDYRDTMVSILGGSPRINTDTLYVFMDSISPYKPISHRDEDKQSRVYTIYYNFDKSDIRNDASQTLDSLKLDLKTKSHYSIMISSFADTRGSIPYNYVLSKRRSKSARAYLIKHGIAMKSIQEAWFGDQKPINHCAKGVDCTEQEFQLNRRTDIRVNLP